MLGRYIAITLVGLGGAMLLAPDAEDRPQEEARAAAAAPDPVPASEPAAAPAAPTTRALNAPAVEPSRPTVVQASISTEPEPTTRAIADVADAPDLASDPAPGSDALALSLLGSLSDDGALPSLETPASVREASVSADTLALISLSEGTAVAQIDLPIEPREPDEAETASEAAPGSEEEQNVLYVTGSRVNVRAGPSTGFNVITSVAFGDAVELIDETGTGWAEIRIADGSTGYMARRFLEE